MLIDDVNLSKFAALLERLERWMNDEPPEYLSIKRAAKVCELSQKHVRRAILGGTLPSSNVGTPQRPLYRISRSSLAAWMKEREAGPKPPLRPGRNRRPKPPPSPHLPDRGHTNGS